MQRRFDRLQGKAAEDLLEEALHLEPVGAGAVETAAHEVVALLIIEWSHRRTVAAAHVVGQDLEVGDRLGCGTLRKQEVAVGLVSLDLLGVQLGQPRGDLDQVVAELCVLGLGRLERTLASPREHSEASIPNRAPRKKP